MPDWWIGARRDALTLSSSSLSSLVLSPPPKRITPHYPVITHNLTYKLHAQTRLYSIIIYSLSNVINRITYSIYTWPIRTDLYLHWNCVRVCVCSCLKSTTPITFVYLAQPSVARLFHPRRRRYTSSFLFKVAFRSSLSLSRKIQLSPRSSWFLSSRLYT